MFERFSNPVLANFLTQVYLFLYKGMAICGELYTLGIVAHEQVKKIDLFVKNSEQNTYHTHTRTE